jgi:hypothetical protein
MNRRLGLKNFTPPQGAKLVVRFVKRAWSRDKVRGFDGKKRDPH